jgi:hypothetical protein
VVDDSFYETLLLEMPDSNSGKATVDFQSFDKDALTNELEGGDLLHDTVIGGLVERNSVDGLVLNFAFGPLLLLCCFPPACGGGCLSLGLRKRSVSLSEKKYIQKGKANPSNSVAFRI